MKRLNKKGFTLVELLAVIIILAIVVGITIPAVMNTTDKAKERAFSTAVDSIKTYIQSQYDLSSLPSDLRGDSYNSTVGTCRGTCVGTTTGLLTATGYNNNISELKWTTTNGKITITCATATGDYSQGSITACE